MWDMLHLDFPTTIILDTVQPGVLSPQHLTENGRRLRFV